MWCSEIWHDVVWHAWNSVTVPHDTVEAGGAQKYTMWVLNGLVQCSVISFMWCGITQVYGSEDCNTSYLRKFLCYE